MDNEKFQEIVIKQLGVLAEGLTGVQVQQQVLLTQQQSLGDQVQSLSNKQDNLTEQVQSLSKQQQSFQAQLTRVETRMENEVIDKIRVLFDSRNVQMDKLNEIDKRLVSVETNTGYLVGRVTRLEKIMK